MLKKIKLNYDWSYFLPPMQDYSIHKGTCLAHQLDELTDIHEEYGLGETYTKDNTVIQQLWYTDKQVDFKNLGEQTGMEVITVSTILQPPGNTIALHRDTFFQINKRFPNDKRLKVGLIYTWRNGKLGICFSINPKKIMYGKLLTIGRLEMVIYGIQNPCIYLQMQV